MNILRKPPLINEDELIRFIQDNLNSKENLTINKETVELILNYEIKYLKSIGVANE